MSYQPIENYGVIGDLNTIALVGLNGSIDFMCFPDFDSPTIFAALLDDNKGGRFSITPSFCEMKTKQLYLPDTNVLLTRFLSSDGVGEILDFMPVEEQQNGNELIRRVINVRGDVKYKMICNPRFNYGKDEHKIQALSKTEVAFTCVKNDIQNLKLTSSVPLSIEGDMVVAEFSLAPGETVDFVLCHASKKDIVSDSLKSYVLENILATVNFWRDWVSKSAYEGRWREIVNRSALVLKLLTSSRFGSMVAAPTFGLPESIGGERNWDYRYTWIRDASFTTYAFLSLGYTREARDFMQWIEKLCQDIKGKGRLGIMYAIDGKRQLEEGTLDNLEGYKGSRPVRIGNDAYRQIQLDIYGELVDSLYLFNKHGEPISYDLWKDMAEQVDWLCHNWLKKDESIWENRGQKQHYLYSRLQCWVCFDRAIKLAKGRSIPYPKEWMQTRDKIFNSIYDEYWNEEEGAFMQYPGAKTVDASCLLMPLIRFISPKDPKWISTLKRVEKDLVSDSLVYRYKPEVSPDGFASREGTFSMCSFWYVECLSKSGQLAKARFYFEKMLGYANHLGLYSEQLGFKGEHLGNFPQAFTHMALISAAINLDKQLNDSRNKNVNHNSI
jgi:GH15 family glucan-1,4-alpha-glucosidase